MEYPIPYPSPSRRPLTARRGRASIFSVFFPTRVWFFPSGFHSSRAHAWRAVEALDISARRREDRGSLISPGPSSLRAERRATSTVAGTCVSVSSSTIGMVKSIRYPLWVKPDASTSFSPSSVNICDALPRSYRSHAVNEAGGSLRRFCSVHGRSADLFFPRSPLRSRSHLRSRSSRPSQEAS